MLYLHSQSRSEVGLVEIYLFSTTHAAAETWPPTIAALKELARRSWLNSPSSGSRSRCRVYLRQQPCSRHCLQSWIRTRSGGGKWIRHRFSTNWACPLNSWPAFLPFDASGRSHLVFPDFRIGLCVKDKSCSLALVAAWQY